VSNPEQPAAASPPWWALLPPAQTGVSCGGHTHQLRWSEGTLIALDHPDAEGERVLAALGGDRCECIDLVESWGAHGDDLEVLAIGPRSAADKLTIGPDEIEQLQGGGMWRPPAHGSVLSYARLRPHATLPARLRARLTPHRGAQPRVSAFFSGSHIAGSRSAYVISGPRTPGQPERDVEWRAGLLSLLALGGEFQFRLSATVAAAWADGGSRAGDAATRGPALVAALAGRVAPAAAAWLGTRPDLVDVVPHEGPDWGRLQATGTGSEREASVALPVGWLASIWAAGLAVTAGHLIVAVTEAAWPDATVLGVPEPGADPVILKLRAADGGWTRQPGATQ
jgi:hypothetical protein